MPLPVCILATLAGMQDVLAQDDTALSFDGFYVGAALGFAEGSGDADAPVLSGGTTNEPFDADTGQAYSVFGGYQMRLEDYVLGAEARYVNLSDVAESSASGSEDREVTGVTDFRGRIGYVTGDWMFYGALGWSWANFRVHPGVGFGGRDNSTTLDGLNYGLGAEYMISNRWSLGADLTFRDLSGDFGEASRTSDIDVNTFSMRLGYQF